MPSSDRLFEAVRATPVARTETLRSLGDASAALATAPRVFHASYQWPIQSHASMGPSCAVADIRDGGGTVWTASQGTHRLRQTIAKLLGARRRQTAPDLPGRLRQLRHERQRRRRVRGGAAFARVAAAPCACNGCARTSSAGTRRGRRSCWISAARSTRRATSPPGKRSRCRRRTRRICRHSPARRRRGRARRRRGPLRRTDLAQLRPALCDRRTCAPKSAGSTTTPLRPSNLRAPGKIGNVFARREFLRRTRRGGRRRSARLSPAPVARSARPGGAAARRRDDGVGAARIAPADRDGRALQRPRHRLCPLQAGRKLRGDGRRGGGRSRRAAPCACCAWRARTIAG